MVYIKKVETRGFKSFGTRPVHVNFDGKFIGITGPNGSGKSNIIDAILFALGENKPRMMRVNKLSGLIFDGAGGNPSTSARVTLTLDNTSRDISIDNDRVTITREIRSSGDSTYLLNGKKTQKGHLSELLSLALISSDGLNFVPQGMVTHLAELNPEEKRLLIEEIVGVAQFDSKKEDALKQLDAADRQLEVAMAKIGEVKKNIDVLEVQRNNHLRLQYLDQERNWLKSMLFVKKLHDITNTIEENNKLLITLSEEKESLDQKLIQMNNKIDELDKTKQSTLSKVIGGASDELLSIQIELNKKTDELNNRNDTKTNFHNEIKKISESLPYLNDMLSETIDDISKTKIKIETLSKTLDSSKNDLIQLHDKMKTFNSKRKSLNDSIQEEEQLLTNIDTQLRQSYDRKTQINQSFSTTDTNQSILKAKILTGDQKKKQTQALVDIISKSILDLESLQSQEQNSLTSVTSSNSKLALRREKIEFELSKAVGILSRAHEEVLKHESKVEAAKEITSKQNIQLKLKLIAQENSIPGYLGGVDDIFTFTGKYKTALQAATKRWSNAIIIEEMKSLFQVVELVKRYKLGRVALIPLSDIVGSERVNAPKNKDILGSLADFLAVDDKYKDLANFIFGDTLLVSSAKSGYIWSQKGYRTVSISGDIFEPGGSVFETGSVSPLANLFFDSTSFTQIKSSVSNLRTSIQRRKNVITTLNSQVKEMESDQNERKLSLERLNSELNNMKNMRNRYVGVISKGNKTNDDLQIKLKQISELKIKQELELKDIDDLIITQKSKLDSKSSIQSLKTNLLSLESEREEISSQIDLLSDQIRTNETTLARDNANLEHNLKNRKNELTEKISNFEDELKDKKLFLTECDSLLPELEKRVTELNLTEKKLSDESRKMKPIIDNLDKQNKLLNKEKESINKNILQTASKYQTITNDNARLTDSKQSYRDQLQLLGYDESLEYFPNISAILDELDKEYNSLKSRVNLLADEQYREIYTGYKNFSHRKNQLQKERNSIIEFINSVDSDKRKAFLDAFEKIDKELRHLFSKLTTKDSGIHGEAWLELENEDDIFTSGVSLMAQFPNKIARESTGISGGEKTVAALCLILAIQAVKPAPFYVFDEIDAHLDAVNSTKLAEIIRERTVYSQIIMVSLKDTILSRVDNMYGVYHERGITKILTYQPTESDVKYAKGMQIK